MIEDEECCCAGRSRGVPGFVLVLPRIGTVEGSSLGWSEGLDWLELGMMGLEGNSVGEKSEKKWGMFGG